MWSVNPSKSGFTLIELLVSTTLGLLLVGGAIASYNSFASRQTKIDSARDVQAVLQSARERSRGGNKPDSGCAQLDSYRVWGVQGTQNYYVAIRCDGLATNHEQITYSLQSEEYFLQNFDLYFPPLPGVVGGAPATIAIGELGDPSVRYEFRVSIYGVIQTGALENE